MSQIILLFGVPRIRTALAVVAAAGLMLALGRSAGAAEEPGVKPSAEPARDVWFPPPELGAPSAIRWDGTWDAGAAPLPIRGAESAAPRLTTPLRPAADDAFWAQVLNQKRPLLALVGLLGLLVGFFVLQWFQHARPPVEPRLRGEVDPGTSRPGKRAASAHP